MTLLLVKHGAITYRLAGARSSFHRDGQGFSIFGDHSLRTHKTSTNGYWNMGSNRDNETTECYFEASDTHAFS